jgi:hypothetical protein
MTFSRYPSEKLKCYGYPYFFIQRPVHAGDLLAPLPPFPMFERKNFRLAPVEMAGNEGCFLVELLQRVAYDTAKGTASTSNVYSHFGHLAFISVLPFWLMRR